MAKAKSRKPLILLGLIVGIGVLITGVAYYTSQLQDRPMADPYAETMTVSIGDEQVEILPYRVCDMFESDGCTTDEDNIETVTLENDQYADVQVTTEVASNTWTLQRFYDDDSRNLSTTHRPGSTETESVPGSTEVAGEQSPLAVVEVSTTVVGLNEAGEETTYGITWSLANSNAAQNSAGAETSDESQNAASE